MFYFIQLSFYLWKFNHYLPLFLLKQYGMVEVLSKAHVLGFFFSLLLFSFFLPSFLTQSPPTGPRTAICNCVEDATVDYSNPNVTNPNGDLRVTNSSTYDIYEIFFMGFELSPDVSYITNATRVLLELDVKALPGDRHPVNLVIYQTIAFSELTITWNNKPNFENCTRLNSTIIDQMTNYYIDIPLHLIPGSEMYYLLILYMIVLEILLSIQKFL